MPLWAKFALMLVLVFISAIGYFKSTPPGTEDSLKTRPAELDATEVGKRQSVQDFQLTDAEGKTEKFSSFRGKVMILSFWSSTCVPCLLELPTFAEIQKKFYERGLRVVAVNVDELSEGKTFAHDFWTKKHLGFPNYFDVDKKLISQFEIEALPTNYVIDRAGRIVFSGVGANDWNSPQTLDSIESLLQETENTVPNSGDSAG